MRASALHRKRREGERKIGMLREREKERERDKASEDEVAQDKKRRPIKKDNWSRGGEARDKIVC